MANFIDWGPASIQVALSKQSPYIENPHKVSGLMLANHTNISELFIKTVKNYELMRYKNAFLDRYK